MSAAGDQGEGGLRAQVAPSQGLAAGATQVGQPLLEPEESEVDQYNRLRNLPASATSVTCKRVIFSVAENKINGFIFFFFK